MKTTVIGNVPDTMQFSAELKYLTRFAAEIPGETVLCVNPRSGDLPSALRKANRNLRFDSFVSDDEWVEPAGTFSQNVYFGYSHHLLSSVERELYDAIVVCEDMGYVDDCDAMLCEYVRLLKLNGVLLCGIWNMSYYKYLLNILRGYPLPQDSLADSIHSNGSIPISTLLQRLRGLNLCEIEVFSLYGESGDVSQFIEISKGNGDLPADEALFLTKTFLIKAVK
jgi:hypothetical protein